MGWLTWYSVYRMRETSDENQILVPHYNYHPGSGFPNRNALTAPAPTKLPQAPKDAATIQSHGTPSITKPPSVHLRSGSDASSIPQGDGGHDGAAEEPESPLMPPRMRFGSQDPRSVTSMSSVEFFGGGFPMVTPQETGVRLVGSSLANEPGKKRVHYNNMPQTEVEEDLDVIGPISPPRALMESLPTRPGVKRGSAHLWAPREIGDAYSVETGINVKPVIEKAEHRRREARVGRFLLAFCLVFPPLLFVMACGGFDSLAPGMSNGELRKIGSTEKKLALVIGSTIAIGAIVGIVVGLSVGITAG